MKCFYHSQNELNFILRSSDNIFSLAFLFVPFRLVFFCEARRQATQVREFVLLSCDKNRIFSSSVDEAVTGYKDTARRIFIVKLVFISAG